MGRGSYGASQKRMNLVSIWGFDGDGFFAFLKAKEWERMQINRERALKWTDEFKRWKFWMFCVDERKEFGNDRKWKEINEEI
jgi:hypothetical protein